MSRLTDEELTEALAYAQGLQSLRFTAIVAELRERRAADLSDEDREALEWLQYIGEVTHCDRGHDVKQRALAVLNRLLGGGE